MVVKKMFYDKDFVPKNAEELYTSGWKEYMLYHINKYSLNDVNHSPEDLLQDMLVQLMETQYIENYDPEVSEFTVYLHTFIRNFMSKPYNREHKTRHGNKIVHHVALVSSSEAVEENSSMLASYDTITKDVGDFTDYVCLANSIEKDLASIKSKSKVVYNGEVINRTPLTVYHMLKDGYNIKEISEIFGTSKQFVYTLRQKIADVIETYV